MTDTYNVVKRTLAQRALLHDIAVDHDIRIVRKIALTAFEMLNGTYPQYNARQASEYLFDNLTIDGVNYWGVFGDIAAELNDIADDESRCEHCGLIGGH